MYLKVFAPVINLPIRISLLLFIPLDDGKGEDLVVEEVTNDKLT